MVRIKHRYLLVNILYSAQSRKVDRSLPPRLSFHGPSPGYLSAPLLLSHLRNLIVLLFGDYGLGLAGTALKILYFSPATSTVILRCPRPHFRMVWAALTFMTEMPAARKGGPGTPCVVQVVRVSGTIRKSEEELLRRARRFVVGAKMADEEGEELELIRVSRDTKSAITLERSGSDEDLDDLGDALGDDLEDNDDVSE